MQWVQSNIGAFGGDKNRVMIFGQSAGAGSMTNHLAMPASAGLFSSVVLESGAYSLWNAQQVTH
jgi:carboxylesterase type B